MVGRAWFRQGWFRAVQMSMDNPRTNPQTCTPTVWYKWGRGVVATPLKFLRNHTISELFYL